MAKSASVELGSRKRGAGSRNIKRCLAALPLLPLPAIRSPLTIDDMEIILNGAPRKFDAPLTVSQLLDAIGDGQRRVAVEVNLEIVPRTAHPTRMLAAGDRVEIVHALGGG